MMDRKKELKEQYKQMKSEMGVLIIRSSISNKCYLETTANLKGMQNRTEFQLDAGLHPNGELQREWQELGKENFKLEILDNLEYDKKGLKRDYSKDLAVLKLLWEERLTQAGKVFYQK
ncbi:MAG: GIY-YIG nuclease family protein [Clostridia bacterium]